MARIEKGELRVQAIKNGSVIDHIPVDQLQKVVHLLGLFDLPYPFTIGQNYLSKKLGRKGIIKVEEKHFTHEEVNRLALVSTEVVISVIRNYEVVEKIKVALPDQVKGLVKCTNPKCISNNEPMQGLYHVTDKAKGTLKCHYCNRKIEREEIIISE
ncbi:aspartate carbamoyltransferase regulatory subunit [Porphyromonas levii]|uniref:aspartate carbamoyltransferase regulatory subunit n=1 Tax=Porphyromonas levii TaxID=28114 RepID=UPI000360EEF0|nr:aspartate carbamoyltransferase regulatory subunit [Porphyromonas levii]MBR8702991.1 Aspartate carbamoyltransferase regulatory chain [Porphyromonas levii]MBR8713783.1 Aspartate carbamoyltransferase regulatory chain [Porphyromonas levii]MBR8715796.1 Aspartate carbamoyltransferase regulatory chain [Porphyromonas levii]MBR8728344.1 Aspartate carbamoyltransferase regulatory chain [Porphyromonas levii]MBR8736655.1 Aspartate carbamoyltransferase regulatory chain [Porphyromonas levii]